MSFPKVPAALELAAALLAIAFGSNFPAYGAGDATLIGVEGDAGEPIDGDAIADPLARWSMSSSSFRVPPAANSLSFRSLSSAIFFFHASSLANRSAFLSSP